MRTSLADRISPASRAAVPAANAGTEPCVGPTSLALVLYGDHDGEAVRRIVARAEQVLTDLSLDYEFLVMGGDDGRHIHRAAQKGFAQTSCQYYLAGDSPGGGTCLPAYVERGGIAAEAPFRAPMPDGLGAPHLAGS